MSPATSVSGSHEARREPALHGPARWAGWLLRLLGGLPLRWGQALGSLVGALLYLRHGRTRQTVAANLALCFPELAPEARGELLRQTLRETGRALGELPAMWTWPGSRLRGTLCEVVGREHLDAGLASARGVLIAAPHLGCWELTSHYAQLEGYRLTALYRPPRQAGLGPLVLRCRQRFGARLVPTTAGGVRELLRALRRGECVGILPDQDPGPDGGVLAPFFGVPAGTMVLFNRLARQSGAALLLAFAERLPAGSYRLHLRPLDEALRDPDPVLAATALNAAIEGCVREYPAQYQWAYRRFKTRPAGTPPRYPGRRG